MLDGDVMTYLGPHVKPSYHKDATNGAGLTRSKKQSDGSDRTRHPMPRSSALLILQLFVQRAPEKAVRSFVAGSIASSNKCIASSNKCLTSSNKKLLVTSASLLVTSALLVVTRSY